MPKAKKNSGKEGNSTGITGDRITVGKDEGADELKTIPSKRAKNKVERAPIMMESEDKVSTDKIKAPEIKKEKKDIFPTEKPPLIESKNENKDQEDKKGFLESWNPDLSFLDKISTLFSGSRLISSTGAESEEEQDEIDSIKKAIRAPLRAGILVSFLFFGVFGVWSLVAPLDSAAIATGVVVLDSNKKTVQHLEGGIIEEILVSDGDEVEEGQVLIRLNETTAEARQALVDGQLIASQATGARLLAERDNLDTIVFPEKLWKRRLEPQIFDTLDGEQRLFETRKKALEGHIQVLYQRIKQLDDEIRGLQAQELSSRDQLVLIQEEILVVQKLLASGDANRPRLLALQRKAAELEGNRGEYLSLIAKARQAITETELEVINIRNKNLNEIVGQLREVQTKVSDLEERRRASKDILDRITIIAPQSGVVTGSKFYTVGGVISPGAPIMNIIPQDDVLVIEARVVPQDIDVVTKGLKARVRLTAFKVRKVPPLDGIVTNVSADKFVDEITGQSYYKAKIRISDKTLSSLVDEIELYPGMPADVLIVTGERTFMTYMLSPITDSFGKAFKEQ